MSMGSAFCLPSSEWLYKLIFTSYGQRTHLDSLPVGDIHKSPIDSSHTRFMWNCSLLKSSNRVMEIMTDSQIPSWATSWATSGHETPLPIPNSIKIRIASFWVQPVWCLTSVMLLIDIAGSLFSSLHSIPLWDYLASCIIVLLAAWLAGFIAENIIVDTAYHVFWEWYVYIPVRLWWSLLVDWLEVHLLGELMDLPSAMAAHSAMATPLLCRDTASQKKTEVCT